MASNIITLNLGTQTVGAAVFQPAPNGGLILKNYRLHELLADGASELSRIPQMKLALEEVCEELRIKRGQAHYTISGQSVFTRFVKLPSLDAQKVDQIVAFEAQQNVPFPIEEVVWDYQLVGEGQGIEDGVEVVLVAIKNDLLSEINGVVEEAGLKTSTVDVAPMALFNAFRYNYSQSEECTLLIDIGGRTSNLVFIEPGRIFTRSVPIGGNSLTTSIAKEFDESFVAAEERKKRDGFVSLGGAYAEPSDPDVARLSKIIRNGMTRLHAEIGRSISFYRAQQKGSAPQNVYLCGGSVAMPYMKEFFQEKLQLPTDYFNPLRNVTVGPDVDLEKVVREAHLLGELVGLSLRGTSECPMELNLQPPKVTKARAMDRKKPFFAVAAACLLVALAGWWYFLLCATEIKDEVLSDVGRKVSELAEFESHFNEARAQIRDLDRRMEPLVELLRDRDYWMAILEDINSHLPPENIWITRFDPSTEPLTAAEAEEDSRADRAPRGRRDRRPAREADDVSVIRTIRVQGLYLERTGVVDEFVRNLSDSEYFDITSRNRNQVLATRSTPTAERWAHSYELILPLKEPIRLP